MILAANVHKYVHLHTYLIYQVQIQFLQGMCHYTCFSDTEANVMFSGMKTLTQAGIGYSK